MPTFHFTSPEGKNYEIEGPEGATQEQAFDILQSQIKAGAPEKKAAAPATAPPPTVPAPAPEKKKPRSYRPRDDTETFSEAGSLVAGLPETAAAGLTGLASHVVGGLLGIGKAGKELISGKGLSESLAAGGGTARDVSEMAFQPRTEKGKTTSEIAGLPMTLASKMTAKAGGIIGKAAGNEAAGETIGEALPEAAAALYGGRMAMKPREAAAPMPGRDYTPLRQMTPEQEGRYFSMKGQGVEPTLGSVTREPAQVRFEQQMAQTPGGERLAQRVKEQDAQLTAAVERIKEGPELKGARGVNETETGRSMRTALESKAAAGKQVINDLYEKARASGETKEMVDLDPLKRYLEDHKAEAISVPKLNSVKAMIEDLETSNKSNPGHATIDQIEHLRQRIGELGQGDGSVKKYMGDLRKGIDEMTEGKGGDMYKEARKARKEWGDEFEEKLGTARILDKPTRTDYKVAVEDVWSKTVKGGSIEDLGNVMTSLRTSKGKQLAASKEALKDMQTHTVNYLTEEATKTGAFSPAGFEKAIRSIGEEKLTLLLGPDGVKSLNTTLQNAKNVKTAPIRSAGSDTFANQQTMLRKIGEDWAEHFMHGVLPRPISRIYQNIKERAAARAGKVQEQGLIEESLTPRRASPQEIERAADAARRARSSYNMAEGAKRTAAQLPAVMNNEEQR